MSTSTTLRQPEIDTHIPLSFYFPFIGRILTITLTASAMKTPDKNIISQFIALSNRLITEKAYDILLNPITQYINILGRELSEIGLD